MSIKDDLGIRMKTFYEEVPKTKLMRRTPVAIRLDGKSFHTFTRNFAEPFDEYLIGAMQQTMKHLCKNIQGCVLGYTQSDEITLILVDYKKLNSSAWFDYEIQKMCSVTASMATMAFNKFFEQNTFGADVPLHLADAYCEAVRKGAMFDARVFNIPKEEVTNLVYWRQLDAIRNSIQMVGQAYFSHKELQNKSCNDIQDMLFTEKGVDWNDIPTHHKRGSCCVRNERQWVIDREIPMFVNEGRGYIERLIHFDDEVE